MMPSTRNSTASAALATDSIRRDFPAAVWRWSFALLGIGAISLAVLGKTTGVLTLALLACIIVYNATHKAITASPWLMGLCRFWVYVIAGSTGVWGLNGWPIGAARRWRFMSPA
jgi:hypothetical protein